MGLADFLQRQWLTHVYDGFPRDLSIQPVLPQFRAPIRNRDNYVFHLWKAWNQTNCWVDVYPRASFYWQDGTERDHVVANKIFIDVDVKPEIRLGLPEVYDEMRAIVRYFRNEYTYEPRTYFSGSKGFHVHVDFAEVALDNFSQTLYTWTQRLVERLGLKTVDWHVVGDQRRIDRIPYTIHPKTGRFCMPVYPDMGLEEILKQAEQPDGPPVFIGKCMHIDEELAEIDRTEESNGKEDFIVPIGEDEERELRYVSDISEVFRKASGYQAGRSRTLWAYIVPRLAWLYSGGKYQTLEPSEVESIDERIAQACEEWVLKTPEVDPDGTPRKDMDVYLKNVRNTLKRLYRDGWEPWRKETFLLSNPELAKYWRNK